MSGKEAGTVNDRGASRSDSLWASLVLGLPLSAAVITFLRQPQFQDTLVSRYLHHPIEFVEITLFCCCLAALLTKLWGCLRQRRALRAGILPAWDGQPEAPAQAAGLLLGLGRQPNWVRHSWLGQRCRIVLDYLCRRGSAAGLDDHVRFAGDNDIMALEASYSFTRFLIWATPILGFLGTVIGISESIAGVSPEQLEQGLTAITGGLATAFDTTGLALMLTLVMMLISFIIERMEQRTLQEVDEYVDLNLFHRFARPSSDQGPMVAAMEQLVQRQADLWAASMAEMDRHAHSVAGDQQERLTAALTQALERSLTVHQEQLAEMRQIAHEQTSEALRPLGSLAAALKQQHAALEPLGEGMHELSRTLGRLQEGEQQLLRLQHLLQQNLQTLATTNSFEEAVHSMTAAAHLLTARSGRVNALRLASDDQAAA